MSVKQKTNGTIIRVKLPKNIRESGLFLPKRLVAFGVHPKTTQQLMRHSDLNLTVSRYTHVFWGQETEVINALPDLHVEPENNTASYTRAVGCPYRNQTVRICSTRTITPLVSGSICTQKTNITDFACRGYPYIRRSGQKPGRHFHRGAPI